MKYKIQVMNPLGAATLLCEIKAFPNNNKKNVIEIIYHQIVSTFDDTDLLEQIRNRQFTIKEELRIMTKTYEIISLDKMDIKSWIEKQLKEVYGSESTLNFEEIQNQKDE